MNVQRSSTSEPSSNVIWRGLLFVVVIASLAFALNKIQGLHLISPMILAVFIGILYRSFFKTPESCHAGIQFSLQKLLKIAIVFLGLQLNFSQVLDVGWNGILTITLTLTTTFVFCLWLGNRLGLDPRLVRLIAAGTSICGASAIVATNSVIKGKDEHVAYAITLVTLFGFLSMLLFPIIGELMHLNPKTFGFWSGISIHETAQVIAAAFQGGQESGEIGTVAKLSRVLFLVPVIIILGYSPKKNNKVADGLPSAQRASLPIPWFVIGFIVMVAINSLTPLTGDIQQYVKTGNKFLLTISLAAMGLQMSFSEMKNIGLRPLCLGGLSWLFVSTTGLTLAYLLN